MGHDDLLSRFDITFAPDPSRKESLVKASATILTLVAAMGCGGGGQTSHTVLVAPRLNLLPYGSVGLVTSSIEKAKGTLNEFATAVRGVSARRAARHRGAGVLPGRLDAGAERAARPRRGAARPSH